MGASLPVSSCAYSFIKQEPKTRNTTPTALIGRELKQRAMMPTQQSVTPKMPCIAFDWACFGLGFIQLV